MAATGAVGPREQLRSLPRSCVRRRAGRRSGRTRRRCELRGAEKVRPRAPRQSEKRDPRLCPEHRPDCSMPRMRESSPRELAARRRKRTPPREVTPSPPDAARQRVGELRAEIRRHERLYYVDGRPEISDARVRPAHAGALRARGAITRSSRREDSPTRRVGGATRRGLRDGRARRPDAVAGERVLVGGSGSLADPGAPRARRRPFGLHRGAEDRRPVHIAALRERPPRARGHARRRHAGRGRDEERPDDPVDPAPDPRARLHRGARRGLLLRRRPSSD